MLNYVLLAAALILLFLVGCSVSIDVQYDSTKLTPKAPNERPVVAVACKTCKGTGAVEDILIRSAPPEAGDEVSRTIVCPECRGKGKVTK